MKKILFILTVCAPLAGTLAQGPDSATLAMLKLNFVVPDIPAFKALGNEPSNLLRPSTPQAFAVSVSEFYQNRALVLPQDFAVEVTPSLLVNAKANLSEVVRRYSTPRNRVLNTFRVSLGTATDNRISEDGRSFALGMRINLINRGDMVTDQAYLENVVEALGEFRLDARAELAPFAHSKGVDTTMPGWREEFMGDEENREAFNEHLADAKQSAGQAAFLSQLDSLKQDYKKRNWNAAKWDVAMACLATSPDSLVENIRFNKLALWSTWGFKIRSNAQLLVGLQAATFKNLLDTVAATRNDFYGEISLPARFLFGTNRVKGFAEVQYSYTSQREESGVLLNLGAEISPLDGFWLHLYGGLDTSLPREGKAASAFIASLKLKLTLPERFNFF